MNMKIEFSMDNAAFGEDADPSQEIKQVLSRIPIRYASGDLSGVLRDSNGNQIGSWAVQS